LQQPLLVQAVRQAHQVKEIRVVMQAVNQVKAVLQVQAAAVLEPQVQMLLLPVLVQQVELEVVFILLGVLLLLQVKTQVAHIITLPVVAGLEMFQVVYRLV
jgi:hypothetical protein